MKKLIIIAMLAIANVAIAQDNNLLSTQSNDNATESPTYFYAEIDANYISPRFHNN